MTTTAEICLIKPYGIRPKRATRLSAGYDLYSPIDFTLSAGETRLIPTGVSIKLPPDYVFLLQSRSGLSLKGVTTEAGVVDADYFPGEIGVVLKNSSLQGSIDFKAGDKISQGIIMRYYLAKEEEDDVVEGIRTGGFGSTDWLKVGNTHLDSID